MAFVPDAPAPSRFVPDAGPVDTGPDMAPPGVGEKMLRAAFPNTALSKFVASRNGALTGNDPRLGPPNTEGQDLGDKVFAHTNSPLLATIARIAPDLENMVFSPGGAGEIAKAAPAAADAIKVAGSPEAVRVAAGYGPNLKSQADMGLKGPQAITNRLASADTNLPAGQIPSRAAVIDARNSGPGVTYRQAESALPDKMVHDEQLTAGLHSLPDTGSQLPNSPDVEALRQTMLDQPNMTPEQLFSNIRDARTRAAANLGSPNTELHPIGDAYNKLAGHMEDFAGRRLDDNGFDMSKWLTARQDMARSYLGEAAVGQGHDFNSAVYAREAEKFPDKLDQNGAIIAHVHNNLPAAQNAHTYGAMAAGSAIGSTLGAGITHLTGLPGVAEAGGLAGLAGGPLAQSAIKNFLTRGNLAAADRAPLNPALSYFRRDGAPLPGFGRPAPELPPTQTSLPLPGGGAPAAPQGTLPFGPPMGDTFAGGPVGSLRPGAPPSTAANSATPVPLRLQQSAASAQAAPLPGPGQLPLLPPEMPKPLGASFESEAPRATANEFPSAPLELAYGAPRSAPSSVGEGQKVTAVPPDAYPNGRPFGGILHRGVPEGQDLMQPNSDGHLFLSEDASGTETSADNYGKPQPVPVNFKQMLDAGSLQDTKSALGLPAHAEPQDVANEAAKAGYDGVRYRVPHAGREYIKLGPPKDTGLGESFKSED